MIYAIGIAVLVSTAGMFWAARADDDRAFKLWLGLFAAMVFGAFLT